MTFTEESLAQSLASIGVDHSGGLFASLADAYAEPHRHYHNAEHVSACLGLLQEYRETAERLHEIAVAMCFHDAVYDTRRGDNEELSAQWAAKFLTTAGADAARVDRIRNHILATKTHIADSSDTVLMIDIDLAILGVDEDRFEDYDSAIRREYHWVPEDEYRNARAAVLGTFLDRDTIYRQPVIHNRFEQPARANLSRKIDELMRQR